MELLTYSVTDEQCRRIARKFAWGGVSCERVLQLLEIGASTWERHLLNFRMRYVTTRPETTDRHVRIESAADIEGDDVLAYYYDLLGKDKIIIFTEDECWHAHQEFCSFVSVYKDVLWTIFGFVVTSCGLLAVVCLVHYCARPSRVYLFVIAMRCTVTIAVGSIAMAVLRGCECKYFGLVAAHEFGHALGLGHISEDRNAVMHPGYYERRISTCLEASDVRLLNTTGDLDEEARTRVCLEDFPVLNPAGVMCLIIGSGCLAYIFVERAIVNIPALRRSLQTMRV